MVFCKKVGRECKLFDYCNSQRNDLTFSNNINAVFKNIDVELLLLQLNLKKIMKKEMLSFSEGNNLIQLSKNIGAFSFIHSCMNSIYSHQHFNVLISYNIKNIKKYILYDNLINDNSKRIKNTGYLLGYPDCCINNYNLKTNEEEKILDEFWYSIIFKDKKIVCPLITPYLELNRLDKEGLPALFSHMPCSNKCKKTIYHAESILSFLSKRFGEEIIFYYFKKSKNFITNNNTYYYIDKI